MQITVVLGARFDGDERWFLQAPAPPAVSEYLVGRNEIVKVTNVAHVAGKPGVLTEAWVTVNRVRQAPGLTGGVLATGGEVPFPGLVG